MFGLTALLALLTALSPVPVLAQNDLPPAMQHEAGILYVVEKGETLSSIARRFTGDTSNWRAIGKLNRIENDRTVPVGTQILIPAHLLPSKPMAAQIVAFVGEVLIQRRDGQRMQARVGELVREGDKMTTLQNSFLSLSLDDGTRIMLQPESVATLRLLRTTQYVGKPKTQLFLESGRIDSRVTPASGNARHSYEVVSPIAVSSVRGTAFRVDVDGRRALNETISGTVAVSNGRRRAQRLVSKGFGTIVEGGRVGAPVALLDAPSLKDGYLLQEKLPLQFPLLHLDAAVFHVQISKDPTGIETVQAARVTAANGSATVEFADLPDGSYFIHYSAADGSGLRGLQGVMPFRVNARPFPPLLLQRGEKFQAGQPGEDIAVTMEWSQQDGVSGYRLQIADDASFASPLFDQSIMSNTGRHEVRLRPGVHYWRVASVAIVDGNPDQGPFGDPRRLEVLAGQPEPVVERTETETRFGWSGGPGQTFTFQLSDSPTFDKLFLNVDVSSPAVSVSDLAPGVYFARVRSMHSDGFVGTFSPPQKFEIPVRWRSAYGDTWSTGTGPVGTDFGP